MGLHYTFLTTKAGVRVAEEFRGDLVSWATQKYRQSTPGYDSRHWLELINFLKELEIKSKGRKGRKKMTMRSVRR